MSTSSWMYLGVLAAGIFLFYLYTRSGSLLKCLLFTAFSGVGSLGVVWLLGFFLNLPLTLTPLSLLVSGVLGIPGVVGMLLISLI